MGVGCVCSLGGGVGGNGGAVGVGVVCVCVRAGVVSAAHHVFGITMADSFVIFILYHPFRMCIYGKYGHRTNKNGDGRVGGAGGGEGDGRGYLRLLGVNEEIAAVRRGTLVDTKRPQAVVRVPFFYVA